MKITLVSTVEEILPLVLEPPRRVSLPASASPEPNEAEV
jgi:hypothetical protein